MERLRVSTLLDYIDPCCSLVVWHRDTIEDQEEEPTWEGSAMDCPYWISKCYIQSTEYNNGDGTIDVREEDSKPFMLLCVED